MNIMYSVNTATMSAVALEKALEKKLREMLGRVPWLSGWKTSRNPAPYNRIFDIEATLKLPGGITVELWVECKADPRPSQFPYVAVTNEFLPSGRRQSRIPVFAAPYISPRMAEICWSHGWSWFDLAGNCRLSVPGAFYLEYMGREPVHDRPKPAANLSTPEAGRIIRALLAPENAGIRWTQRSMEMHFGHLDVPIPKPSLGLVNKVVRHLRDEAFIESGNDGGFRLRDPVKLLFAWRDAYRFERHLCHDYFTLLQGKQLHDALAQLGARTGNHAVYASFSAADFQAPYVRQSRTWLYVREQDVPKFEKLTESKPVESGGNLVLLIPDDDGVFYCADGGRMGDHRMACTNVVQTYIDLWNSGGRGQEAAEALLEQKLKPEWKRHKLL
jgi:hypothetical protein